MKGAFDNLKGIGKPLQKDVAADNPFISAEDYLLNAYVQRNGATPPWVELQQGMNRFNHKIRFMFTLRSELDASVNTLREILQNAWIRRATRMLSASYNYDPVYLSSLTEAKLSQMRDSEWENKERAYHEHAVAELNSQVRRYNGLAPYSVRRGLHTVEGELARCYAKSGRLIFDALKTDPKSAVHGNSKTSTSELGGQSNEMSTLWYQLVLAMRSLFRL
jgi:DnaJ homolog subfamily C member 28